jgi:hypothetical protein
MLFTTWLIRNDFAAVVAWWFSQMMVATNGIGRILSTILATTKLRLLKHVSQCIPLGLQCRQQMNRLIFAAPTVHSGNGSVMAIMRNCLTKNGTNPDPDTGTASQCTQTSHRFNHAYSHDGGATFGPIRPHPDLVTPGCEGGLTSYKGAILFSGPYSTLPGTAVANPGRSNGSILASFDDGITFNQSLRLQAKTFGYSSIQCGLPGPEGDCAVLYACGGGLAFTRFQFADVK